MEKNMVLGTFLVLFLFATFSKIYITVSADDPEVYAVESSWWRLSEEKRIIKWLKTSDYDYPGWMTKDKNSEYDIYWPLVEHDDDYYYDDYSYPYRP